MIECIYDNGYCVKCHKNHIKSNKIVDMCQECEMIRWRKELHDDEMRKLKESHNEHFPNIGFVKDCENCIEIRKHNIHISMNEEEKDCEKNKKAFNDYYNNEFIVNLTHRFYKIQVKLDEKIIECENDYDLVYFDDLGEQNECEFEDLEKFKTIEENKKDTRRKLMIDLEKKIKILRNDANSNKNMIIRLESDDAFKKLCKKYEKIKEDFRHLVFLIKKKNNDNDLDDDYDDLEEKIEDDDLWNYQMENDFEENYSVWGIGDYDDSCENFHQGQLDKSCDNYDNESNNSYDD